MQIYRSRVFRIGPFAAVIESVDADIGMALSDLFDGFEDVSDELVGAEPQARVEVIPEGPDRYRAMLDGELICADADANHVALSVTRRLNRLVLDHEPDRLHLHAGAVTRGDATVLVVGSSHAGKSTLVAKLVEKGWSYLSDEQIGVTPDGRLVAFPRPITLRVGSWSLFDEALFSRKPEHSLDRMEIAPSQLGTVYRGGPLAPTLIVCPDVSILEPMVQALPVAESVSRLLAESLDLERSGESGLQSMVEIATQAPSFEVLGTDLESTCQSIADLCEIAATPGPVLEHARVRPDERSDRVTGTLSWLFSDGSATIYEPASGQLVQVDEVGFHAWQVLGTDSSLWPSPLAESSFVTELWSIGLLISE